MTVKQSLIPVVRVRTKEVLGVLNTGGFIDFDGDETTFALPASQNVDIDQYFPHPEMEPDLWYMAYLVDEDNFRLQTYLQYTDFETVNSFNTKVIFQSPSTMPNLARDVDNALIDVIDGSTNTTYSPALNGGIDLVVNPSDHTPAVTADYNELIAAPLITTNVAIVDISVRNSYQLPPGLKFVIVGDARNNISLVGIANGPTEGSAWSVDILINTLRGSHVVNVSGTVAAKPSGGGVLPPLPNGGVAWTFLAGTYSDVNKTFVGLSSGVEYVPTPTGTLTSGPSSDPTLQLAGYEGSVPDDGQHNTTFSVAYSGTPGWDTFGIQVNGGEYFEFAGLDAGGEITGDSGNPGVVIQEGDTVLVRVYAAP